ncbi:MULTISPECIES: helix-turn-helix transcriptional regulator [unclassified Sinorhizobium]|uniref:AraC family transcriptional regulator n=1 Tax=unclassified Sinorhizobium TaxID=2613772 RepID=UPI0024C3733B|nr:MULTISPECIES: helix-turn-helix transcriptional regulator [unclassified Sinorhizobium]MDK1376518.1 helix-turn-helix transcriptional regulator [Sinorhizobium sp. 6-70]MDK1482116.1 helix-turn-helix transcriptional regulator [Sinorhizobium sp. 6-117]
MIWHPIAAPPGVRPPQPITVRAQSIPARHYFPEHSHTWHQLVYAISGVLTVYTEAESFVITPDQAVWLPTGVVHRVGSLLGAVFRSLWIADAAGANLPRVPTIFMMSPLLQALIVEATELEDQEDRDGYSSRVTTLILDQLVRVQPLPSALPWPRNKPLTALCEALYLDPTDDRSPEEWGLALNISPRTLARRFNTELGMSLRSWRRRLRLFRAIELLGGGLGVTQVAMELGYGSTSAFVYAFRTEMGSSPQAYMRRHVMESASAPTGSAFQKVYS